MASRRATGARSRARRGATSCTPTRSKCSSRRSALGTHSNQNAASSAARCAQRHPLVAAAAEAAAADRRRRHRRRARPSPTAPSARPCRRGAATRSRVAGLAGGGRRRGLRRRPPAARRRRRSRAGGGDAGPRRSAAWRRATRELRVAPAVCEQHPPRRGAAALGNSGGMRPNRGRDAPIRARARRRRARRPPPRRRRPSRAPPRGRARRR